MIRSTLNSVGLWLRRGYWLLADRRLSKKGDAP